MIPVARNVSQHVDGGSPAEAVRRLIIARNRPPRQRPTGQPLARRVHALKQCRLRLLEPGRLDVLVEGRRRPVAGRDIVPAGGPPSHAAGATLPGRVVLLPASPRRRSPELSCRA